MRMASSSRVAAVVASVVMATLPMAAGFHAPLGAASLSATRAISGRSLLEEGALAANSRRQTCDVAPLMMSGGRRMRVAPRNAPGGSSAKRAGRLGKMVMTELVGILRAPYLIKVADGNVDAELVSLISVVEVDMSGDNKVAKVMVSAMGSELEKKKAVAWLNKNARAIRFSLAQRISHIKTVPELRFTASALAESMEVMSILDQLRQERDLRTPAEAPLSLTEEEEGEQEVLRGLGEMMMNDEEALFGKDLAAMSK